MDNTKGKDELKVITCKKDDKSTFQAICFVKKMKQHELLTHLLNKELINLGDELRETINQLKRGM